MSIYLTLDTDEPTFLASNKGYGDFSRWAESVDGEELHHLTCYGWSQQPKKLRQQLQAALENSPPERDTAKVAGQLLSLIDDGKVIGITEGFGSSGD